MRRIAAAVVLAVAVAAAGVAAGAPRDLRWADLRPAPDAAAAIADPFATMPEAQLEALRGIVRLRELEARGFVPGAEAKAQRDAAVRALEAQGLSVAELLATRDAIIAQRRAAAEAGVPALDGVDVRIPGFLLPVDGEGGRVTEFLLVAIPGACSHATPPPANQVIRVRPREPAAPTRAYQPATVRGVLRNVASTRTLYVVDGTLDVTSAYAIDAAEIVSGFPEAAQGVPATPPVR